MKITILTQSDPFFLAENISYLIKILPVHSKIVSTVVFDVSPFGKRESFFNKAKKTVNVFGLSFFMHFSIKYWVNKFNPAKSVYKVLQNEGIPIIRLTKSINHPESISVIKSYKPDLLISIAGNQIFKKQMIALASKGCLNLHTALLPQYRGLMPTFWVMKNDEKYTGVSVFFVDEGIDSGPIVVQERVEIGNRTQAELIKYTKKLGMEAIAKAIDLIEKDEVELIENDDSKKTYFSFPKRKDVKDFLAKGKKFF